MSILLMWHKFGCEKEKEKWQKKLVGKLKCEENLLGPCGLLGQQPRRSCPGPSGGL
jgi:hypothetical protein